MKPSRRRLSRRQLDLLLSQADRAFHVALRASGNAAVAEEAVQEAFAVMIRKPPTMRSEAEWTAYFLQVVRGVALNARRGSQREKIREEFHAMTYSQQTLSGDEIAARKELGRAARTALSDLPQPEREAVSLCCEMDMTHHEAAGMLGVPESTLGAQLHRGLERLRTRLVTEGFVAVVPVGIAGALGHMGPVAAPANLTAALNQLSISAATAGKAFGAKASASSLAGKKAATAGAGAKAAVFAVVAVTFLATAWYFARQPAPQPPLVPVVTPPIPVAVPAATPATAPPIREITEWQESFNGIEDWQVTAWCKPGNLDFQFDPARFRTAPGGLWMRYNYPEIRAATGREDDWLVNHRTVERTVKAPASATHVRLWIQVIACKPGARFNIAFYPAARKSAWSMDLELTDVGPGWHCMEAELRRMPEYWQEDQGVLRDSEVPPLPPESIAVIEMGGNIADAEWIVDDIEFFRREPGVPAAP